VSDSSIALDFGFAEDKLPTAVLFHRGVPEEYPEDLNPDGLTTFTQWVKEELSGDDIPVLELNQVCSCRLLHQALVLAEVLFHGLLGSVFCKDHSP